MPPEPPTASPTPTYRPKLRFLDAMVAVILALIALYLANLAQPVLIPILISILAALTLAPAVRVLQRARVPRFAAAFVIVALTVGVAGIILVAVAEPAQIWIERAPAVATKIEKELKSWRAPVQAATDATERVLSLGQAEGQPAPMSVVVAADPMVDLLKSAPSTITSALASVFLTFLLLLHGNDVSRKFLSLLPGVRAKREFLAGTKDMQRELSHYLLAITIINAGLGVCTAVALWWLGITDALLWGGLAMLLNFAPYVGPAVATIVLLLVGYSDAGYSPGAALSVPGFVPAAVFLTLHGVESQMVTPLLLGRRLALDPVIIFVSLMALGWLWGIIGLLIAVPLLTSIKVAIQRFAPRSAALKILSHP